MQVIFLIQKQQYLSFSLLALQLTVGLSQMNREDQDFKVWERDDYSFLRWYVTKQMESLAVKDPAQPFLAMIREDPLEFIDRISEDNVALDEVFLTAAALLFHKDIVIIPADESKEIRVLYGGPGGSKGKGTPLYLGSTQPVQDIPSQFYSINPDSNHNPNFILEDRKVSVGSEGHPNADDDPILVDDNKQYEEKDNSKIESDNPQQPPSGRGWKRMDSYVGSASKDLDAMINEIVQDENMEELFTKLDNCDDDAIDEEEMEIGNKGNASNYQEDSEKLHEDIQTEELQFDGGSFDQDYSYTSNTSQEKSSDEDIIATNRDWNGYNEKAFENANVTSNETYHTSNEEIENDSAAAYIVDSKEYIIESDFLNETVSGSDTTKVENEELKNNNFEETSDFNTESSVISDTIVEPKTDEVERLVGEEESRIQEDCQPTK